jgi:hypothetical protein
VTNLCYQEASRQRGRILCCKWCTKTLVSYGLAPPSFGFIWLIYPLQHYPQSLPHPHTAVKPPISRLFYACLLIACPITTCAWFLVVFPLFLIPSSLTRHPKRFTSLPAFSAQLELFFTSIHRTASSSVDKANSLHGYGPPPGSMSTVRPPTLASSPCS